MAKTARRTWQRAEGRAAALFGSRRQYGSGGGGREDQTRSDSTHPRLFLELKLREVHTAVTLWGTVKHLARLERKVPVCVLSEKNRPGQWLVVHTDDLDAVMAERMAAMTTEELDALQAKVWAARGTEG